jgi:hypothetical protein
MGPELAKEFVQLVRVEADTKNELAKRQRAIQDAGRVALREKRLETNGEQIDLHELIGQHRNEMTVLFELLLTAPESERFIARPQTGGSGFSRFRNITVEGFGEMEVARISSPDLSGEVQVANYRLAVVGLPEGFTVEPALDNSPVIAQLKDWNKIPLGKTELTDLYNEALRLKDQLETLTAVSQAAGLLPADAPAA